MKICEDGGKPALAAQAYNSGLNNRNRVLGYIIL